SRSIAALCIVRTLWTVPLHIKTESSRMPSSFFERPPPAILKGQRLKEELLSYFWRAHFIRCISETVRIKGWPSRRSTNIRKRSRRSVTNMQRQKQHMTRTRPEVPSKSVFILHFQA